MFARKRKRYLLILLPIIFLFGFSITFYYVTPADIIGFIGVQNAYLLIFLLAFIGGLTTFSGVPYHLVLIALAAGGLNPFLLAISAATGVMLGDSTSYYLGHQGRLLTSGRVAYVLERLSRIKERYPRLLPWVFFLYGAIVPLSNDVITIPMGLLEYPFWRVMIPLGLGNIVFNIWIALLAAYGFSFLQ